MLRTFLPMLSDLLLRISWDLFLRIAAAILPQSDPKALLGVYQKAFGKKVRNMS
jgi:hypothetical protein